MKHNFIFKAVITIIYFFLSFLQVMSLRLLKSRGVITTLLLLIVTVFIISKYDTTSHRVKKLKESSQLQQTPFKQQNTLHQGRLDSSHQRLLSSALAHIRLGYVANRTPDYSTPPLLVLYSCKNSDCGSFSHRLIHIANHYYFSMLQQGSAFAYDMTFPVRFEWYFEPLPVYMSMNTDQAKFYADKTPSIYQEPLLTAHDLSTRSFSEYYQQKQITIVNTTEWQGDWEDLSRNPSMKALRDKYRLNHLRQTSDWFWIVSQLLFSQPTPELRGYLEPYRDIMGGKLDGSTSLSPLDPAHSKVTPEYSSWLRVGLRVNQAEKQDIKCMVRHVVNVCKEQCHVFVSASSLELSKQMKKELQSYKKVMVHGLDDSFDYADFNQDERKETYLRIFMEWLILSKMDYLVGQEKDEYLKTAAWAAQVQTDLLEKECKILPMTEW